MRSEETEPNSIRSIFVRYLVFPFQVLCNFARDDVGTLYRFDAPFKQITARQRHSFLKNNLDFTISKASTMISLYGVISSQNIP